MGALAGALLADRNLAFNARRRVRCRRRPRRAPGRDTYFGVGPIVGLSLLLGNWRHLADLRQPGAGVRLVQAQAATAAARRRARLRAALEAELHFGFVGVPALSIGLLAGMGFQYESVADTRALVRRRAGRRQRLGRALQPVRQVLPLMPRKPPPDSDLKERRELLDAAGIARTLRRMAHEIVERIRRGEAALPRRRPDGRRLPGAAPVRRAGRGGRGRSRRWAPSTSRSTATTSSAGCPSPRSARPSCPSRRRADRRAGRRRAVHGPHGARGDGRARRLWPARAR